MVQWHADVPGRLKALVIVCLPTEIVCMDHAYIASPHWVALEHPVVGRMSVPDTCQGLGS